MTLDEEIKELMDKVADIAIDVDNGFLEEVQYIKKWNEVTNQIIRTVRRHERREFLARIEEKKTHLLHHNVMLGVFEDTVKFDDIREIMGDK